MNYTPLLQDITNIKVESLGYIKTQQFLEQLNLQDQIQAQDISQYIYLFKVHHTNHSWIIRKRVIEFVHLEKEIRHDLLLMFKSKEITKEKKFDDPDRIKNLLFDYLTQLLNNLNNDQPKPELMKFLEISDINIGNVKKYKEAYMDKQAGGRFSESRCARCGTLWGRWSRRYFCITDHGIMYSKKGIGQEARIRENLTFDYNFKYFYGKKETGHERGIILQFSTRHLYLNAPNLFLFTDFVASLKQALTESPYLQLQRFDSFAPLRQSQCKWYIDGSEYFCDVMQSILNAKSTVMITDWWLSPDLYLKRPISVDQDNLTNKESRLDRVLKNVADRGVSVMIIVYQEPTLALNNDSWHTKTYLEQLSRNIQVLRHPSQIIPSQWSHHEKMVVIDNEIGYMGGLDLCFGRMDTQKHILIDNDPQLQYWPGIDYSNCRQKDFYNVKLTEQSLISREEVRMPWHDIAIKIVGGSVCDLARHFTQYWNHVIIDLHFNGRKDKQMIAGQGESLKQDDTKYKQYIQQVEQEQSNQPQSNRRISGVFNKEIRNSDKIIKMLKSIKVPNEIIEGESYSRHSKITHQESSESQQSIIQYLAKEFNEGTCQTQIVRSASTWSIGCAQTNTEFSIQLAYIWLIETAKNYIYIENQFFISCSADPKVFNKVADALVNRIITAATEGEKFKVIVFVPLLPGFEGEIDSGSSGVMKVQLHWEYNTICRGGNSIIEQLRKDMHIRDPFEYIEFYSLRTHANLNGQPKTEQIYIHSKLMIIDDDIALIGSANINDRSLLGSRDSEIAIVVKDSLQVPSIMNGAKINVGKFAHTLRTSLYMEHFGLTYDEVVDPLNLTLQEKIRNQTQQNTYYYREIFACYPDDTVNSLAKFQEFKKSQGHLSLYEKYGNLIKGHAVQFPLDFLQNENLKIKVFSKEFLVPDDNFT